MTILDSTIVNVAIERLAVVYDAPLSTIQWVSTGYLLALAAVIGLAGSALSGSAWSAESLIFFRVLQGLGGGMLLPAGMTILTRAAGAQRVGRVMSIIGVRRAAGRPRA